jgi:predicted hydrolase (HD superfamily)
MASQTKRANFEITPDQEARLHALKEILQASSLKDAILRTSTVMLVLARELDEDSQARPLVELLRARGHDVMSVGFWPLTRGSTERD